MINYSKISLPRIIFLRWINLLAIFFLSPLCVNTTDHFISRNKTKTNCQWKNGPSNFTIMRFFPVESEFSGEKKGMERLGRKTKSTTTSRVGATKEMFTCIPPLSLSLCFFSTPFFRQPHLPKFSFIIRGKKRVKVGQLARDDGTATCRGDKEAKPSAKSLALFYFFVTIKHGSIFILFLF